MVRIPRVFQEFASKAYRKKIQSEPPMPAHQARMDPPRGIFGGRMARPHTNIHRDGMFKTYEFTMKINHSCRICRYHRWMVWHHNMMLSFFFPFPLLTTILLSGGFLTWANFATAHKILDISRGLGSHGTFLLKRNPFPPMMQEFAANKALEPPVKLCQ